MRNVTNECVARLATLHVFQGVNENTTLSLGKTVSEKLAAADAINATIALREALGSGDERRIVSALRIRDRAATNFMALFNAEWPLLASSK